VELTTIFYHVDNFCNLFEKNFKANALSEGQGHRNRPCSLKLSEVMSILIFYHHSGYKTFKHYYTNNIGLKLAFPGMPSYTRFIELQKNACIPLTIFIKLQTQQICNGVSFIDSFPLRVSHEKRISSHKTFRKSAARGKTSVGWFYGFKVHLVINGYGEILDFTITPGNIADNNAKNLAQLTKKIHGKLYGDKGYLVNEALFKKLFSRGLTLVTKFRNNMKNKLMDVRDKMMLKKRGVIESVGAVLKEDCNIEHSRYRSPITLLVNVCSTLAAYVFRQNKPSIYKKAYNLITA
jgi:hypothetical protein